MTARLLADRLGLPYVELDALNHGPGWVEATPEELRAKVAPIVAQDAWVIDGSYRSKLGSMIHERADTIVWLDLPIRVWLPRLARRTLRRMVTREELWNGNRERVRDLFERPNIFEWAFASHRRNRRTFEASVARHADARLVRLRSPREVREYLGSLRVR
jgi:adenylate kinase family enzyme